MSECPNEREITLEKLHQAVIKQGDNLEELLWNALLAYQGYVFYTSSGLPFSYIVKRKKNGEYSGELLVSRKESSKTLTKSSVFLAFRRVAGATRICNINGRTEMISPEYKGPKAIGQIFGISYIYSIFWEFGLIRVPDRIEKRLAGIVEKRPDDDI